MSHDNSPSTIVDWLAPLLDRYRVALHAAPTHQQPLTSSPLQERYETLRLAAGVSRQLSEQAIADPLHIAVVGPTQVGKSSLVNRLVGLNVAGVSALAGHTVHAQAFIPESIDQPALRASLQQQLLPLQAAERQALTRDELGSWSAQNTIPSPTALAPDAIVWDTPDFDSIEAGRYREAVLAPAALADIIVVVLSKDKYADLSAWQRIDALATLGTPLIVVLNKLDDASRGTVAAAFATRWTERTGRSQVDTLLLPWMTDDAWPAQAETDLRNALQSAATQATDSKARITALETFIDTHTASWLMPLREAAHNRQRWQDAVADIQEQAMASYTSRYLNDTSRFDAVQRTVAELLTLLELPGIARTLAHTRTVVTWPARKLLGIGRRRFQNKETRPEDRELEVLHSILREAIFAARERARDAEDSGDATITWRALDKKIAESSHLLEEQWQQQAEALREEFQPRIEATAHELHDRLSEQPALLNTLRATRVTTDAAGIALAVKSGGLAPGDLILAPAMLSITTLLTESALGKYLDSVGRRLKDELAELVRERLVKSVLGDALIGYERALAEEGLLGRDMDPKLERVLLKQHAPK